MLVNVYLFVPGQSVLKFFNEILFQVFVPILLEIPIRTVETACPLLLVEVDFVCLVDEVG